MERVVGGVGALALCATAVLLMPFEDIIVEDTLEQPAITTESTITTTTKNVSGINWF